jgi:Secretion system C-terminal sorting domain
MEHICTKKNNPTSFKNVLTGILLKKIFKSSKVNFCFIGCMAFTLSAFAAPFHEPTSSVTIKSIVKKSYNGSDISCSGSTDAQLTIMANGGSGVYQYSINNGSTYQSSNVFSNLAGGQNYVVKVKDSNGSTSDATWIYVNQAPSPITISGIQKKYYYNGNNDVSCSSASDGQISISAWGGTGTLHYSADNGATFQTSNVISGLSAGTYQVVVKDANDCIGTSSVTLRAPSPVGATIVAQTSDDCSSSNKGTVTVLGSGGVGLYYYSIDGSSYQWSGTFTKLAAGLHWGMVKDNNGCTGPFSVTIASSLTAVMSGANIISPGQSSDFFITIVGIGNNFTAVYQDNNGNQFTANNLNAGINTVSTGSLSSSKTYTLVSVTNPSGCTGTVSGSAIITVFSSCQWLGLSSNWNDVTNWLSGILPSSNYSVLISASGVNPVIKDADVSLNNLTLSPGVKLTVLDSKLTIGGTLSADTGAIIADQGTVEYNGSVSQIIASHTFKNNALHDLIVSNTSASGLILGGPLDIYGSLNFTGTGKKLLTNDTLTLKSTATETAMAGNITGNTIEGKVTVERFIPGVKKAWRFLAVPTMPGQSIHDAWQEGQPANNTTSISGKGIQITSNIAGWNTKGFDASSASPSIKTYNSATNTWTGVNSLLTPFSATAGGYLVFVRGDRSANSVTSPVTPTVLRTKGQLYTGDQPTITVTPKQFIAVSNPYAAPLDLRKIDQSKNLFYYVWDPNLGTGSGYGAYQTLKKNGKGNYVAVPGGGSYSAKNNNLIQSGSAFFVYNKKGGYLTITEDSKADNTTDIVAFTPATATDQQSELTVQLYGIDASGNATLQDGVLQDFDDTYSDSVDEMDAQKSVNLSENLSIRTQGQLLAVESKHSMTTNDTTFLNLTTVKVQNYRFEIDASNLSANGMQGFLEDSYLGTKTPLNMSGVTDYNFAMVNIPGAYAADRFRIVFQPTHALAVTITSLTASQKGKTIAVEWKVDNQPNIKEYEIEKSADGNNFSNVATVQANSNATTSYSWTDVNPVAGYNYYRVKSVAINGKTSYTQIVKVQADGALNRDITVFPNPIVNGTINLQLTNQPEGVYHVRVINQLGQAVLYKQVIHNEGSSSEAIQLDSNLAHGVYQVEVSSPANDVKVIKVLY